MEKVLGTGDLAEMVGIKKTSLKHYISVLEKSGYEIRRDHRNYRSFDEQDVALILAYAQLHNKKGMTLKEAAAVVTAPDFDVEEVEIIPPAQQVVIEKKNNYELERYADLSNAMELLADHVKGIESQNAQLIQLIQAQHEQNELLMQQNETLKEEFSSMKLQIEAPKEENNTAKKQLDRVESQNSAIMAALNRINVQQHNAEIEQYEEQKKEQSKGLMSRLFKK